MALPLLGLLAASMLGSAGMTFANDWRTGRIRENDAAARQASDFARAGQAAGFVGASPMPLEGPTPDGSPLMSPGSGLLADPTNPANQIQAGIGLMGMGGDYKGAGESLMTQGTNIQKPITPFSGIGKLQGDLTSGRINPGQYQSGLDAMMKPGTQVNIGDSKLVTATDAERIVLPDGSRPPPGTRYSDLPALGATFVQKRTPEQAGKIAQLKGAQDQIPLISNFMFNSDGSVDRTNVFNAQVGIPGSEGQTMGTAFEAGIQAITRSETGAAMPETEVDNARKRFQPKITDTDLTIRLKWQMYQDFLNGAVSLIDSGGVDKTPRFNSKAFDTELKKRELAESLKQPPDEFAGFSVVE